MSGPSHPSTVLDVIISDVETDVRLLGVCAGYESQEWRYKQLVGDFIRWAPDWILKRSEIRDLGGHNMMDLAAKALKRIYVSEKYEHRGELGELLLHMILRKFMGADRAISRIFFKDAPNDTVKGFDGIFVVPVQDEAGETELELWLGESKFYRDSARGVRDVLEELEMHLATDYLRTEFAAITDKIEPDWEHASQLTKLLDESVSLDEVFRRVVIPVFITFDSEITQRHRTHTAEYSAEMTEFVRRQYSGFQKRIADRNLPASIRVHLILMPLATKEILQAEFDGRLKAWQQL